MTSGFRVVNSQPEMAEQLAHIQRASFPELDEDSLITAAHYPAQIARFPEGQFAVLSDGRGGGVLNRLPYRDRFQPL